MGILWPSSLPDLWDDEILLRAWRACDADAVFVACQDSQIQRYTKVPVPYLREDAESFVGDRQLETLATRAGLGFAVTGGAEGEVLGAIGLVTIDIEAGRAEAGYWTAPWARRHGVARRALRLITNWVLGDLGFEEVYLEIESTNTGSIHAAEQAGFRSDHRMTHDAEHRGERRPFMTLTRTASDR